MYVLLTRPFMTWPHVLFLIFSPIFPLDFSHTGLAILHVYQATPSLEFIQVFPQLFPRELHGSSGTSFRPQLKYHLI